jgi:hypothetical protein
VSALPDSCIVEWPPPPVIVPLVPRVRLTVWSRPIVEAEPPTDPKNHLSLLLLSVTPIPPSLRVRLEEELA